MYITRKRLKQQGFTLPDIQICRILTPQDEIRILRNMVKDLKGQVKLLSEVKDKHEEALNYLFAQVSALRAKQK